MRKLIKAVGFVLALATFYVASMFTWVELPPTAGPVMARLVANQADARGGPYAGQKYSFTDNVTGKVYTGTILVVGASYQAAAGYVSCTPTPLRCIDDSDLPSCTIGVDAAFCDSSGGRVDYVTPTHRARAAEYIAHGDILPGTITQTRASWIKQNEADAVIGNFGGTQTPSPTWGTPIDMSPVPGSNSWFVDFATPFGGVYTIIVGPCCAT